MGKKSVLAAPVALVGLGYIELYRFIFFRFRGITDLLDSNRHSDGYYERRDNYRAQLLKKEHTRHEIKSRRGVKLVGNYFCCGEKPSGKIAFIVHGYRADGAEAAGPYADYYLSKGWDVFCCDHASHGESGGLIIGYDFFESDDCLDWIDYLIKTLGNDIQVILHGFSMGGGIVLKMSDRIPQQVRFICSDSGFSDAVNIIKPKLGLLYQPIRSFNMTVGRYDIEETDVRPNLRNARVPILFVHGMADPTVPFEMGKELYDMCPTEKDCLFIEGVRHVESIYYFRKEYESKLDDFIERYTEKGEKNEVRFYNHSKQKRQRFSGI